MKTIAFYLPQFHPIKENDLWYGKGFTEWTNVAKAKPLFRGHYQPHVPADLGFYDLRLEETRQYQAQMAQKYGLSAFCYWYYWFGEGKELLEMPIWKMHEDKSITLPFCVAWANGTWKNRMWDSKGNNQVLMVQKYLGEEDYTNFFYRLLPLFKDERYYKINGKLLFLIHQPLDCSDTDVFVRTWRKLAAKEKIGDFYFLGETWIGGNKEKILSMGIDGIYDNAIGGYHHSLSFLKKLRLYILREFLKRPTVFKYKDVARYMVTQDARNEEVFPVVAPNWDHSPRTGRSAIIYSDCKPKYFLELLLRTAKIISNKDEEKQIVFIKSWNEWGEGNHLEPDLRYGCGYLEALKKAIEYSEVSNDNHQND